jgi:hypothetical protein
MQWLAASATAQASKCPNSDSASSPDLKTKIINYVRAGYPGLYLVSPEEQRVDAEMIHLARELSYSFYFWSVVDGLIDSQKGQCVKAANDPLEALLAIGELKDKAIVLLKDFHLFLEDPNPILIRQLKDVLQLAKTKQKTLIVLGCRLCLPPELEREFTVIEFALPNKEALGIAMNGWMSPGKNGSVSKGYWKQPFEKYVRLGDFVRLSPAEAFVFLDEQPDSINDGWFKVATKGYSPLKPEDWPFPDLPAPRVFPRL